MRPRHFRISILVATTLLLLVASVAGQTPALITLDQAKSFLIEE